MTMKAQYFESERFNLEEEDIDENINFRRKINYALEDIKRLTLTNQRRKELLQDYEKKEYDYDELRKTIVILKNQLEEAKRVEEEIKGKNNVRKDHCAKLENENISLRNDLKKENDQLKFGSSYEMMCNLLNN